MKLPESRSIRVGIGLGRYVGTCFALVGVFQFWQTVQPDVVRLAFLRGANSAIVNMLVTGAIISLCLALHYLHARRCVIRARVRANFSGLLPNKTVRALERSPAKLNRRPRERVVTVMFVDMAGFSLSAEEQDPQTLFAHLQQYAGFIQRIVHRYGGTVDKLHGDGVLCYFGYDFLTGITEDDQANRAVKCAIAIQKASLQWSKRYVKKMRPVYPLRIGINTGTVMIGDIGNGERYDYTIVGHGVNYAKRMEQCCGFFKIMISATTKELLRTIQSPGVTINKKLVQVKHFSELREAFEIDSLFDRSEDVEAAINQYRRNQNIERRQERFEIAPRHKFEMYTDFGCAKIHDYSLKGLGVSLNRYLANGCEVTLRPESQGLIGQHLISYGIHEIVGEVRWAGVDAKQTFHHGLKVKNLSQRQLTVLHTALSNIGVSEAV